MTKLVTLLLGGLLLASCSQDESAGDASSSGAGASSGSSDQPVAASKSITSVRIDIGYATGAAPHTESGVGGRSPFDLSQVNLERLFPGRAVTIPSNLAGMSEVTGAPAGPYTSDAILQLAAAHRPSPPNDTTATVYLIWLNGYFADDSGTNEQVLGVSLGHTGVVAMFKPVIEGAGGLLPTNSAAYVEQSTLVHEVGHAAGLVDNGIALTSAHRDTEHGAHCTNTECIMYWQNEGREGLTGFLGRNAGNGAKVLYGDECLADIDAAKP